MDPGALVNSANQSGPGSGALDQSQPSVVSPADGSGRPSRSLCRGRLAAPDTLYRPGMRVMARYFSQLFYFISSSQSPKYWKRLNVSRDSGHEWHDATFLILSFPSSIMSS